MLVCAYLVQICYCYGATIRDDYAVMHYGFLPALEDPPRLLMARIVSHEGYPCLLCRMGSEM